MATYVLVHGAFTGGWQWKNMVRRLRQAGHEVYAPTLTGLGEREHLARPDTDLDTHITDITNVLRFEDLWDVLLVGWSYAGMVITGVAERVPERLRHLIYLDAAVPRDGESLADVYSDAAYWHGLLEDMLAQRVWRMPPPPHDPVAMPNRVDHPVRTLLQPVTVRNPQAAAIPRTYIHCTENKNEPILEAAERSAQRAREAGWGYRTLRADHECVVSRPEETARLLLELAG